MLPTFLGIGAQRCGTTWLYQVLAEHPGMRLTGEKEVHFFSQRILWRDLGWYERCFGDEPAPAVRGEICPSYSTLAPRVVEGIAALLPELRLVLTIRHPVERAWSNIRMLETRWMKRRVDRVSPRHFVALAESVHVRRRTDYVRTIETWSAAFGREALLVNLFEDQVREPARTLRTVLEHVGADGDWSPPARRLDQTVYAGPQLELPAAYAGYLARQWLEPTRRLDQRLAGRVSPWVEDLAATAASYDGCLDGLRQTRGLRWRLRIQEAFYAGVSRLAVRRLDSFRLARPPIRLARPLHGADGRAGGDRGSS